MTTRIGIDFDGTTADVNAVKSRWIRRELGLALDPWECNRTSCVPVIGVANYERMGAEVYEQASLMATREVAGFSEAIAQLRSLEFELHLVTARPDDLLLVAKDWLKGRGLLDAFADFHSSDGTTKEAICGTHGLEALVDDERHLRTLPVEAILIHHGRAVRPGDLPRTVHFCSDWATVRRLLAQLFR